MGFAVARYRGLLEGQLLRVDMTSALLDSALLMGAFLVFMTALDASRVLTLLTGTYVLVAFLVAGSGRPHTDSLFVGAGVRARRRSLQMAARSSGAVDLALLDDRQIAEFVDYLGKMEAAGFTEARLDGSADSRLDLLGRDEFVGVRDALGLTPGWTPVDGVCAMEVAARVRERLEPRERQVLGLRSLGYSDKEMARLMGVRQNVPRSYLGESRRKLALSAGVPTMLFVHFAGLVESDALPLLDAQTGAARTDEASSDEAARG